MPTGDVVHSEGKEYLLGPPLKAGMIGIVYSATNINKEINEKVAVKVPVPNLSSEGRIRFWQEYEILTALAGKMTDSLTVPAVSKGKLVSRGVDVLLLEYVSEDTLLTSWLLPLMAQGLQGEKLGLQAAVQYTRLLEHLHSIHYTCPDRKLADLRWLEAEKRLIVLDWNVVESDSDVADKGVGGRANDFYLFGSLWYQLLTGRYPSPNLDPLNNSLWRDGQISYGTRRLLTHVLAGRYETAFDLRTAVQNRLHLLAKDVTQEAKQLYQQYIIQSDTAINLEEEWAALDKLDLTVRQNNSLQAERDEALVKVQQQGERLVSGIKQAFLTTRYDEGKTAVQQANALAGSIQNHSLQLRIARWRTLIEAGQAAITEAIRLRPHAEKIAGIVKILEEGIDSDLVGWQERSNTIENLLQHSGQNPSSPTTETGKKLTDYYREALIWQHLASAEHNSIQEKFGQALADLRKVETHFQAMVAYQNELHAKLPNIENRRQKYEKAQKEKHLHDIWEQQTDLALVVGKPAHIAYMLSTLIPTLAPQLNDSKQQIEDKQASLTKLANLYHLVAYAQLDPQFWPDALSALSKALKDEELKYRIQVEAKTMLQESYEEAKYLSELHTCRLDKLAAKIYTIGLEVQGGLTL